MRFINYLKTKMPFLSVLAFLLTIYSCGSYSYNGKDNDGVYGTDENEIVYQESAVETKPNSTNETYYKNYFKEKSQEYDYIYQEEEVFTDIDTYEGEYAEETDSVETENTSYAGWGQESNDVTINIYSGFTGYNYYNYPYYGNWGFGWGYGYNSYYPYWYGGYYSYYPYYGGYYPYYHYGHNQHYYGNYGVAYNSGRRGSSYNRISNMNRRSNTIARNSLSESLPFSSIDLRVMRWSDPLSIASA